MLRQCCILYRVFFENPAKNATLVQSESQLEHFRFDLSQLVINLIQRTRRDQLVILLHRFVKLEQKVAQMQILAVENLAGHGAHIHLQV